MQQFCVFGNPIAHSKSPLLHNATFASLGFEARYGRHLLSESSALAHTFFALKLQGANITVPFKEVAFAQSDEVRGIAKEIGAVNTWVLERDRIIGYNTDGAGFMLMLEINGIDPKGKKILVLGAGGAGRSVIKKLADAGADVYAYDLRTENLDNVYRDFGCFTPLRTLEPADYDVIINVTGVGMHKTEGISPVGEDILSRTKYAVDLIYYPRKSEFLRIAESLGKQIINGEGMLFYQAYYGDCIVLGKTPQAGEAKRLFEAYKRIYSE